MKKVGFVFSSAPHGSASGREGLDAVLSTSSYSENLALFFVGDGVLQLLKGQAPEKVLCRDYISTFKMLSLCDVEEIYVCQISLEERGIASLPIVVDAEIKSPQEIGQLFEHCDRLVQF
ncbi:sulfurtransferase complex subunit TusC [Veronia nyctiphanis]|uniref:Protein TusC homolog n=1 Tax=Veronia nyctiphanis TaxID=1278244 RepID=A0A4Q0YS02_9GAMM|nr:sulfurtransferase complex subunit TusC [Veronia nyctiphanis]RXJ73423.1 sulfurtransferase complex subunit TusC [Veronia nyctiphanis]